MPGPTTGIPRRALAETPRCAPHAQRHALTLLRSPQRLVRDARSAAPGLLRRQQPLRSRHVLCREQRVARVDHVEKVVHAAAVRVEVMEAPICSVQGRG